MEALKAQYSEKPGSAGFILREIPGGINPPYRGELFRGSHGRPMGRPYEENARLEASASRKMITGTMCWLPVSPV